MTRPSSSRKRVERILTKTLARGGIVDAQQSLGYVRNSEGRESPGAGHARNAGLSPAGPTGPSDVPRLPMRQ